MARQIVQPSPKRFGPSKSIVQCLSLLTLLGAAVLITSELSGEQMQSTVKSDGITHQRVFTLRSGTLGGTKRATSGSGKRIVAAAASALTMSSNLPSGTVATPYFGYLAAIGGVSPYFFSVSAGALPQGLVLDSSTGEIKGTPTAAVSKTFWIRASDSAGNSGKAHVQITITGSSSTQTASVVVSLSPTSASMTSGMSQQFSASVQGTSNTAVNWGASAGSITNTGLFTAPNVSTNTGITITAISAANSTSQATAGVSISPSTPSAAVSIAITPNSATLASGSEQQFSASVQGTSNTGVAWSATTGSVSTTGLFTAPVVSSNTSIIVTAATQADPTVTSSARVTIVPPLPVSSGSGALCGTDSNGVPSDNSHCGVSGTNPYSSENSSDLTSWCGGSLPGVCTTINGCTPTLAAGSYSQHSKYYLTGNLSCNASALALQITRYIDINLNGFTVTGVVFSNLGVKGWHLFNGTVNCSVQYASAIATGMYAYGCLEDSNIGGAYTAGGGDQILVHHITGQNSLGCSKFMDFDGNAAVPSGGWTEPLLVVYNNTFQSVPVTTACKREYAGVYSETQPVEFYNNRGDVGATGQANATQLLVVYGPRGNGSFPNYIHNNYLSCETFNVNNSESGGDNCRAVLCDGALSCHVQYNDIWPTNNRAVRLRDAFNAEVDHNYIHGLIGANGYMGAAFHTGDNDIHSGAGQTLKQNVHDNTIEIGAGSLGIMLRSQQGVSVANNSFICAQAGCTGAKIADVENSEISGGLSINQTSKVLSCSTCDFYGSGRLYKTGSAITLSGWNNSGNNGTFVIATGPTSTAPNQMVLSDPANSLVNEIGTSSAAGFPATELTLQNASFGPNLAAESYVMPQAVVQECSDPGMSVTGGGTVTTSCN